MEITNKPLEWTSEDKVNLAHFLNTQTGSRLLPKVAEMIPVLLETGDTNSILIRSGKVLGAQEAIRVILELSTPEPAPATSEDPYPALNDDSKWNDGKKIQ